MTNHNEPIESIESPEELTEQDQRDLENLWGEAASDFNFRSVLLVWDEVLKQENIDANRGVTLQAATMLCGRYPQMRYADVPAFEESYFVLMESLAKILHEKVDSLRDVDGDPLGVENAEDDAKINHDTYIELLTEWQLALTDFELLVKFDDVHVAAHVAALGEVQNFFFGTNGLTGHLEVIKLEFTEADQIELATKIQERHTAAREA